MKISFSDKWLQLRDKVNALSVRERAILAGAVAVLLLGIFDQLLLRPWLQERAGLATKQQAIKSTMAQLSSQLESLESQLANDPNDRLKESIARLNAQHQKLDVEISKITDGMIAPELMPSLLGELLSERSGLKVQSIKTRPAIRLLTSDEDNQTAPAIYRHELDMRLEGRYEQVQRYLKSIEALPQKLVWDELEFAIDQYPLGELSLAVHTLSAREELIRVAQ